MVNAKALKKGRCKGNDDTETETGDAQADCAGERTQVAGVEAERGSGGMKRLSDNTWEYHGWHIEYWGDGYRLSRIQMLNGKWETMTAKSQAQARMLIDRAESEIKMVGHIIRGRK